MKNCFLNGSSFQLQKVTLGIKGNMLHVTFNGTVKWIATKGFEMRVFSLLLIVKQTFTVVKNWRSTMIQEQIEIMELSRSDLLLATINAEMNK